jgi:hypothetical protein
MLDLSYYECYFLSLFFVELEVHLDSLIEDDKARFCSFIVRDCLFSF